MHLYNIFIAFLQQHIASFSYKFSFIPTSKERFLSHLQREKDLSVMWDKNNDVSVGILPEEDCFPWIPVALFSIRWLLNQLLNNGSYLTQIKWQPESPQFSCDECLSESTNALRDWVEKEQIKNQACSKLEVAMFNLKCVRPWNRFSCGGEQA